MTSTVEGAKFEDTSPRYRQLAENLRKQILEGKYERDSLFPTESELIDIFNVSRATVRQAIDILEQDGLVRRKQGKGTFVASTVIDQNFLDFHNFVIETKKIGKNPSFQIVKKEKIKSSVSWNRIFDISSEDDIWLIERVKKADSSALMFERIFLPVRSAPDLDVNPDIDHQWLSSILPNQYDMKFDRIQKFVEPIVIGEYEAKWLGVKSRSLGLLVDRLTYSDDNKVLFVTRSVIRGDVSRYAVEIYN